MSLIYNARINLILPYRCKNRHWRDAQIPICLCKYTKHLTQFFSICKTCTYQLQKGVSKWVFHL